MKFLKKYLKFFIGVAVIVLVGFSFFLTQHHTEKLENSNLDKWVAASQEQRITAVQILTASDENIDLIVKCIDKMSSLDGANTWAVSDAVRMCNMGIQLKQFN
ncbi:MAG: hypothetical protein ACLRFI_03715 [Alphaproteobacteria bacterium]